MDKESSPVIKVYFNSACPVCDAGIRYQQRKLANCGVQNVEWKDVHINHVLANDVSADLEFVRERLHVIDAKGDIHVGFNAFIAIWRVTANKQWIARLASNPLLNPLLNGFYNVFARILYRWNRRNKHW